MATAVASRLGEEPQPSGEDDDETLEAPESGLAGAPMEEEEGTTTPSGEEEEAPAKGEAAPSPLLQTPYRKFSTSCHA